MKYCDLHCDALSNESACALGENLRAGGCLLQGFAVFERHLTFSAALSGTEAFEAMCRAEGLHPVRSFSEIAPDRVNAFCCVEGGEALEGKIENLVKLYTRGVRLITLTWNYPNELGTPAFFDYEGLFHGRSSLCERNKGEGLSAFGREAVEEMLRLGILADVSHGSDRLVQDVASISRRIRKPFVASHSNADAAFACARNLGREEIRAIAACGGVVGLNFCADFLSEDGSREGQREAILRHVRELISAGGEDVVALGSDFDGCPENPFIKSPGDMPAFLHFLSDHFGSRVAEKIAALNVLRVLKEGWR